MKKKLLSTIIKISMLNCFILISSLCFSQAGTLDETFNFPYNNNRVWNVKINNNQKIAVLIGYDDPYHSTALELHSVDGLYEGENFGYQSSFFPLDAFSQIAFQNDNKIVASLSFLSGSNGFQTRRFLEVNQYGQMLIDNSFQYFDGRADDINIVGNKILLSGNSMTLLNENGTIDNSFNFNNNILNGHRVRKVIPQPNGKFIVFAFDWVNSNEGISSIKVLRINSNGSLDNSFTQQNFMAEGLYFGAAIQENDKIILGHTKPNYNGNGIEGTLVRLNSDGSIETSDLTTLTGVNGFPDDDVNIWDILTYHNKIIVGGDFGRVNGNESNNLAMLNADGSFDSSFNVGSGTNGFISHLNKQFEDKLIISGAFTEYNNESVNRIARINLPFILQVPDISENNFYFYPNPVNDILNYSEFLNNLEVYSAEGKKVLSGMNTNHINVSNLKSGTYFLNGLDKEGNKIYSKFIKE